jgi:hypothetical protein
MDVVNRYLQELTLPRVLATVPEEYEHSYRPTFRAAALNTSEAENIGFTTGHAIVANETVHQHMDAGDGQFCLTTVTQEGHTGGYVYFPDLNRTYR